MCLGFRIRDTKKPIPDPGFSVKRAQDPGYGTLKRQAIFGLPNLRMTGQYRVQGIASLLPLLWPP
jgi:hypothetical protein